MVVHINGSSSWCWTVDAFKWSSTNALLSTILCIPKLTYLSLGTYTPKTVFEKQKHTRTHNNSNTLSRRVVQVRIGCANPKYNSSWKNKITGFLWTNIPAPMSVANKWQYMHNTANKRSHPGAHAVMQKTNFNEILEGMSMCFGKLHTIYPPRNCTIESLCSCYHAKD